MVCSLCTESTIKLNEIKKTKRCPFCLAKGHKKCVERHIHRGHDSFETKQKMDTHDSSFMLNFENEIENKQVSEFEEFLKM